MRLHVLAPPHTRVTLGQSHCAFTMKAHRLGPMMKALGYETILYSVGQPDNPEGWSAVVEVMTPEEQQGFLGYDPLNTGSKFIGDAANVGSPLYQEFNRRLMGLLNANVTGDDIICLTFGHAHMGALDERLMRHAVETGIGYPTCCTGWRIYESHAWMNWHQGKEQRNPWLSEWVVPNYFDVSHWPERTDDLTTGYVLYFGRIDAIKGLNVVWQLAKARPDVEFVICGQGDASPWLTEPNITYLPPVHGMQRAELMHGARCVLMPTQYVEPFGGVSIEAMLTGTPCLTSDHSVFVETIPAPLRSRTLADWLTALEVAETWDGNALRQTAIARFGMEAVGKQFDAIFRTIPAMRRDGFGVTSLQEVAG